MTAIEDQVQEELIKTQVESLMSAIDQEKLTTQVDSLKLDGEQQKPPRSPKCVGRCDIELGAITKHNAMVFYIFFCSE
jgi:hypothetical protein